MKSQHGQQRPNHITTKTYFPDTSKIGAIYTIYVYFFHSRANEMVLKIKDGSGDSIGMSKKFFNPFAAGILVMKKPGTRFALAKHVKKPAKD